ncbi:MAG: hypothetical protein ACTSWN_16085 [Promethearchaeota archaeon]
MFEDFPSKMTLFRKSRTNKCYEFKVATRILFFRSESNFSSGLVVVPVRKLSPACISC